MQAAGLSPITTMSQLAERVAAYPDHDFTQTFIAAFSSMSSYVQNSAADWMAARNLLMGRVLNDDKFFTAVVNTQFLTDIELKLPDCYAIFSDRILSNDEHFRRIFRTVSDFRRICYDNFARYVNKILASDEHFDRLIENFYDFLCLTAHRNPAIDQLCVEALLASDKRFARIVETKYHQEILIRIVPAYADRIRAKYAELHAPKAPAGMVTPLLDTGISAADATKPSDTMGLEA